LFVIPEGNLRFHSAALLYFHSAPWAKPKGKESAVPPTSHKHPGGKVQPQPATIQKSGRRRHLPPLSEPAAHAGATT